jgi:predicted ATP-dependent Lon-type protease
MSVLADPSNDAQVKLEAIIDEQVSDMWKAMYSDDIGEFVKLMRNLSEGEPED